MSAQTTTTPVVQLSQDLAWDPDLPVVTNSKRVLRPGAPISVYRDDVWSLAPIAPTRKRNGLNVNFNLVPARFREALKQATWIVINEGLPDEAVFRGGGSAKQFQSAGTISVHFHRVAAFLRVVTDVQPEVRSLRGITQETMEKAARDSSAGSPAEFSRKLACVRQLHDVTRRLDSRNRFPEPPWLNDGSLATRPSGENSTPILPTDIAVPLLLWALAFINEFADDILLADAAVNAWQPKHEKAPTMADRERILSDWAKRFGTELPSTRKSGTLGFALAYAGFLMNSPVHYLHGFARPIRDYPGFTLSQSGHCPVNTPVRGQIHGQIWQPQKLDYYTIPTWRRHLQSAAMIVLGLDGAIRPEELLNLEVAVTKEDGESVPSLEAVEAPDGQVRHLVRGRKFKGQSQPDGVERTWALTEFGAQAVRVLIRMNGGKGRLFAARGSHRDPTRELPVMTNNIANQNLRDFAAATRALTKTLELPEQYLLPDDAEDFLILKTLRRTSEATTQEMVGGVLAGAHQAGHTVRDAYDTKTTEGYGSRMSTTKTGWGRQTTDRATALAHLAVEAQTAVIGGPAAARATRIAEMAVSELHLVDAANLMTPLRSKEWRRITASLNQDVYEVELAGDHVAFCIFDVTRSMCTEEGEKPDLAGCRITCQNKALSRDSVKGLELRRQQLLADSQNPALTHEERLRAAHLADEYRTQIQQSGLADEDNQ
jgi:hypothetical protein